MKQRMYKDVRDTLKTGDLIAFGGDGKASEVIKAATNSNVSHVGVVLSTTPLESLILVVQIIESTKFANGFSGVGINRMSTHVEQYDGDIWVLPLKDEVIIRGDIKAFTKFLLEHKGKPYDVPQAIMSAIDFMPSKEDFSKLFCSEYATGAYEAGKFIPPINASKQTPVDVCRFNIYYEPYQLVNQAVELW